MEGPTPKDVHLMEDSSADISRVQRAVADCGPAIRLSLLSSGSEVLLFRRHEPPFVAVPTPKLILLALSFPGHDGRVIPPEYQTMPGVVSSGAEQAVEEQRYLELGAIAYVQK